MYACVLCVVYYNALQRTAARCNSLVYCRTAVLVCWCTVELLHCCAGVNVVLLNCIVHKELMALEVDAAIDLRNVSKQVDEVV